MKREMKPMAEETLIEVAKVGAKCERIADKFNNFIMPSVRYKKPRKLKKKVYKKGLKNV